MTGLPVPFKANKLITFSSMKYCICLITTILCSIVGYADDAVRLSWDGGEQTFKYIEDAIDASNELNVPTTLTLIDDIDDPEYLNVTNSMTIDLNGHYISSMEPKILIFNGEGQEFVIKDSSEDGSGIIEVFDYDGYEPVAVTLSKGTLTLESGTIWSETEYENAQGVYINNDGTLIVKGGKVLAYSKSKKSFAINSAGNCNISISGGEIKAHTGLSSGYALYMSKGTATIDGGTFIVEGAYSTNVLYAATNSKITVNGGCFNKETKYNEIWDVSSSLNTKSLIINQGYFKHELYLDRYVGNRFVSPLPRSSEAHKAGYRYYITDTKPFTGIAKNIQKDIEYSTLEDAIANAVKGDTVSLVNDYTLTHDLTIPKGVMLLIPSDGANTCYTNHPESSYTHIDEYVFRQLNVSDGVKITIEGGMSLNAVQTACGGGTRNIGGEPQGPFASVKLGKGATIDVKGQLYCWGFISDVDKNDGTVIVEDGATLYESFFIGDCRGGNISYDIVEKVFPINQYYVQNVESKVVFRPGSRNILGSDMEFVNELHRMDDIPFIGIDDGLFRTTSSTEITRTYNGDTDRIHYHIDGNVTMGYIELTYGTYKINTTYNICPLPMNITVDNGTMTMPYDYYLLAGSSLTIGENATLNIEKKCSLYLFDREDWGPYCIFYRLPLYFTMANGFENRTISWVKSSNTKDALSEEARSTITSSMLDVQGKVEVQGALMTTQGGASIVSTNGKGIISFPNGTSDKPYDIYMALNLTSNLDTIPMTSAQLTNADGTKTPTTGVTAIMYEYKDSKWIASDINGIENIVDDTNRSPAAIYNIAGQRVLTPTNGMFIRKNKKFHMR